MDNNFINKFNSNVGGFQKVENGRQVKSSAIDAVKIPFFNQTDSNPQNSLTKKIKSLVIAIVAWWNSKADTKAFLAALGGGLTENYSKIYTLRPGGYLTFNFKVPKTKEYFDGLYITMNIHNNDGKYQLKHENENFGDKFELREIRLFATAVNQFSESDIKELRDLVKEVRAADIRSKADLAAKARVRVEYDKEYVIDTYAKQKAQNDPTLQKKIADGIKSLSSLGYVFSNKEDIVDADHQVKHSAGKIKFHSLNIRFADKNITLKNDIQLTALCEALIEKPAKEQGEFLQDITMIISKETKNSMQEKIKRIVEDKIEQKFTESNKSLNGLVEYVEMIMFPTAHSILAENLENLTKAGNSLYDNNIKPALEKMINGGKIKGIISGTKLTFSLIKTNDSLAKAMLGIFGSIKVQNGWHNMKAILTGINQELPVGNQEAIEASSKKLADLGFDMRPASNGEMGGLNLLHAWNKYKETHTEHNFWNFLESKPLHRDATEVKGMRVVSTNVSSFLTQIEQISKNVVESFDLTTLTLEKVCEKAQQLNNSKVQPNFQPSQQDVEDYGADLDKLFSTKVSAKLEKKADFKLDDHVNKGLLEGVKFGELSQKYTTYQAIAIPEAYKAGGASSKTPMFIMGDTHAAYGYHLFTFLMKGLKKDADINAIATKEELHALKIIMEQECSLEINNKGMDYDQTSHKLVANIFNKLSQMCTQNTDRFKELFDLDSLQGYLLLGDNLFDRKMAPLIFESFLDFMIALRKQEIIPEQILGNHDIAPINDKSINENRQFTHFDIGYKIMTEGEFCDRILEKQKNYIKLNTFVKYLPESKTYISHAGILAPKFNKNKVQDKKEFGLYLGRDFKLYDAQAVEDLNNILKADILKDNNWDNNSLKFASTFTDQRPQYERFKYPLNRTINQIHGHDGAKKVEHYKDNINPELCVGFCINLNCNDLPMGNTLKDGNHYNTCGIWLYH